MKVDMKRFISLIVILFLLGLLTSIASSEEVNQEVFLKIDPPFYSVEGLPSEITFIVVNNGNDTFTGS
jgi:putative cell wall-binding protein